MKINVYTTWIYILHAFKLAVLWMLLEYIFEDYAFEFTWIDLIGRWTIALIWVRFFPLGSNDARKETLNIRELDKCTDCNGTGHTYGVMCRACGGIGSTDRKDGENHGK